jgi:hypothetical protein
MVGGPIAGKLHYRVNWKWRTILNLCAYNVKDPSTLTTEQRFTRLYRASLRRHHLLSIVSLRLMHANHKNFFEHAEKTRLKFEKAKDLKGPEMELFMKDVEEWLEITFFPASSHWPTRLYTNKYHLNVPYPDPYHEADPAGYYSPKPLFGAVPSSGPYFQEYPQVQNLFVIDPHSPSLKDPYLYEHIAKIEDPEIKKKVSDDL